MPLLFVYDMTAPKPTFEASVCATHLVLARPRIYLASSAGNICASGEETVVGETGKEAKKTKWGGGEGGRKRLRSRPQSSSFVSLVPLPIFYDSSLRRRLLLP